MMPRSFRYVSAWLMGGLLAASVCPVVQAQQAQERGITLGEALEMFSENNLELREARSRAGEVAALARQAAAYPNPSALVTHEPVWRSGDSFSETYLNVSQRFEWPGLRRARVEAAEELADAAYADLQADSLQHLFELTEAYTEAVAATQRFAVLESVTEIFRRADRANELMLAEGEASGYQMRRLRIERARYENQLALAELDGADARRRLALLIQPEGDASQVYPADPLREIPTDLALETALQHARGQRAELESAGADVEAAQARLDLARRERLPEPTFTAGLKRQSDGFTGFIVGTSLPIPLFDRNTGTIQAREERLEAARARLLLVEARVVRDVRRAYETYASLSDRVELISRGLLGEADELLHAARVGYAEGELSLVELLDAAEAYRDARVSTLELLSQLQIAYFDLLRAAGGSIDRFTFTATN